MNTLLYSTKNEEFAAIISAALNDLHSYLHEESNETFEAVERGDGFYDVFIMNRVLGPVGRDTFVHEIKAIQSTYLVMKGVTPLKEEA